MLKHRGVSRLHDPQITGKVIAGPPCQELCTQVLRMPTAVHGDAAHAAVDGLCGTALEVLRRTCWRGSMCSPSPWLLDPKGGGRRRP